MSYKNSLTKVDEKHLYFGSLKEDGLLSYSNRKDDLSEIINNTNKYLDKIQNENYKYTLNELCKLLEINTMYANTYFVDKLDTLYITRTCKLYIYALKTKDTKQIKSFASLFKTPDKAEICKLLAFADNKSFNENLEKLNLTKERLLKKYFIKENSIKRAIKEVFKKEIKTRAIIEDEEITETKYIDIDNLLINEIIEKGLISTNTLKKDLELKTDTQLHRVLRNYEELENLRLAVVNDSNKHNTIRYINNRDIIEGVKTDLENEKKMNEEFAKERYKREKFL